MIEVILRDVHSYGGSYDEKYKKWLRYKLLQVPMSGLNKSYFKKLLRTDNVGSARPQDYEWDLILFNVLRNVSVSTDSLEILKNTEVTDVRTHLWASLLKVFPTLTAKEWRNLPAMKKCFIGLDEASRVMLLFDILTESLLFLFLYTSAELLEDAHVLSCFKFSVQNLGSILQQELLPNMKRLSSSDIKTVFEKIVFLMEKSPEPIKELWSLLLVPILTKIMSAAVDSASNELGSDVNVYVKEMCCAISISSISDVRSALARHLAELLG